MAIDPLDTRSEMLPVRSGIGLEDRKKLAQHLNDALASTFVLYSKTLTFHWNVAGPLFYSVHKLTDDQYKDLAAAVDDIAERVRAVGYPAMGGLAAFVENSAVRDTTAIPTAREMVGILADDHHTIAAQLREAVAEAEKTKDVYTADLLTARIGVHEEAGWMLNAILVE